MAIDSLLRGKLYWMTPLSLNAVLIGTLGFYAANANQSPVLPDPSNSMSRQQGQLRPASSIDMLTEAQKAVLAELLDEQPIERIKAGYANIGMNVGDIRRYSQRQLEQLALDLQAHGVTSVRVEIMPDWHGYGYFFDKLLEKRISALALLNLNLIRMPITDIHDKSDAWIEQYASAVQRFLNDYGNKVNSVQILNEPNDNVWLWSLSEGTYTGISPDVYAAILKRVYPLVKRKNPDIEAVIGGLLPPTALGADYNSLRINHEVPKDPIVWLDAVLEASGGEAYFDSVAVHPYLSIPELTGHLQLYRQHLDGLGLHDKQIIVTEAGYTAGRSSDGEAEQARHTLAYLNLSMRGIAERVYLFTWKDFSVIGESGRPETIRYGVLGRPSGALLQYVGRH